MINIAIIPARSGSKGLMDKNTKLLNGKPLLAYTIEAAQKSNLFETITVSTDSEEYADIAVEWGASVPCLRDKALSTETANSWDVVKNVLHQYKKAGKNFDTIALLQPTSPLRTFKDIINGYNEMVRKDANAIVAVCEVDHSPLWSNTLPADHSLNKFIDHSVAKTPRESLPTFYRINGALYIVKTDYLLNTDNLYRENSFAYIMAKEHSVDIDDIMDFKIAETIMKDLI